MSVVRQLFGLERRDDFPPVDPWSEGKWNAGMVWQPWNGGGSVGTERAMRVAAVFACLRLLSEGVSTLPIDTYVRSAGVRRPYRPRPAYLDFAGDDELQVSYFGQLMMSLLTDGNAYVATPRDRLGVPISLRVLDPCLVKKYRVPKGQPDAGRIKFDVGGQQPKTGLTSFDIMHIPGMMLPGAIVGLSPIGYAREVIGTALAAQEFGGNFFQNGGLPSANLRFQGKKTPEQAREIATAYREAHGGSRSGGVGVLSDGAELVSTQINQRDAQFIELRQFQVPDIARIFGVPPHLIADASNSTSWGSGLAEQNLAFGQFSLRPWLERIEAGHGRLFATHLPPGVFMKMNLDALLRASLKDRYDAYKVGIDTGFLEIDEARAREDDPPSPDKVTLQDAQKLLVLMKAGYDPLDAARAIGIPPIQHTGKVPGANEPEEDPKS